jgi:hypothetical protein
MKKQMNENLGAAILDTTVMSAIPPPVREPRRAPESRRRNLAASVSRAERLERAMAKLEVYRGMLYTRSRAPLRLSHELTLILTNCEGGQRAERN